MHANLIRALAKVDRPGEVCAAGDLPLTMPGLEVEGVGTLRLPLAETQARALIKRCRQAPYGKGTQTLVDTDVRRGRTPRVGDGSSVFRVDQPEVGSVDRVDSP